MQRDFTITVRDLITLNGDAAGFGPTLAAAIALGKEDKVPGSTGTKNARLTRQLKQRYQECFDDLKQVHESYTLLRQKMDGDAPVLDKGEPVMEPVPLTKEYRRRDGTLDSMPVPGRFMVKDGFDAAIAALMESEVTVKAAPFTVAEFDALAIKPEIKEGLLPFLDDDATD